MEWRPVVGYEGTYEVSSAGEVRSTDREVVFSDGRVRRYKGQPRAIHTTAAGYPRVTLKKNGAWVRLPVHFLVAFAFLGPRPEGLQILHSDGDPSNNHYTNLRYGTAKENSHDSVKHGTRPHGSACKHSVLTEEQVTQIKKLRGQHTGRELARMFNTSPPNICNILQGKRWIYHT